MLIYKFMKLNKTIAKVLLTNGVEVNSPDEHGRPALF